MVGLVDGVMIDYCYLVRYVEVVIYYVKYGVFVFVDKLFMFM